MSIALRDFQSKFYSEIEFAWLSGHRDVMGVLPCGAGKSVVAAYALSIEPAPSIFIAHRAELISGESLALARAGVRHRIIGQPSLARECTKRHLAEGLANHVNAHARVAVASVNTLVNMADGWADSVRLVVTDECHHLLVSTIWGKARAMFRNARGLGLTATPHRADGKGLGRHADGLFDTLIEGPSARRIELMGFLTPHKIYAPPSDLDLSAVTVSANGDYSAKPLVAATRRSHIVGDVVSHYMRIAPGKLGMTFCVDVQAAIEQTEAFRAAGIAAEVVTGNTQIDLRNSIFRKFRQREITQLVSVDIAGEGFDLPDVEVISLARATQSYSLATQQIGRVKRILPGKTHGIVIDHVGNTTRHCSAKLCPDTGEYYIAVGEREWSLNRCDKRATSKSVISLTICPKCLMAYERVLGRTCPSCGHRNPPADRSAPELVDGELTELDPNVLARIQADKERVDGEPVVPFGASPIVAASVRKRHAERQDVQAKLRHSMAVWAGWRAGDTARLQREFWLTFGVDVLTAQTLGRPDAESLNERITKVLLDNNVTIEDTDNVDIGDES